jgi:hypothetical protein
MIYKYFFKKGSVIVLVLFIVLILFMYLTALLSINRQNLVFACHQRDYLAAKYAAESGVNQIAYKFTNNPGFGLLEKKYMVVDGNNSFVFYFNQSMANGLYSINNLASSVNYPTPNFEGKTVRPGTADVVVIGSSRIDTNSPITHKIHVIFRRTFDSSVSIGSSGKVNLTGDIEIKGIKSISDLTTEFGGGIHSNLDSTPSISWNPGVTPSFKLGPGARISTTGTVSSNLNFLSPSINAPQINIPLYSILELVERKSGKPGPPGIVFNAGLNSYYSGYLNLTDEYYLDGNLVVNGDVNLSNGSLFVKGNIIVNGGIKGFGSIFASGNVEVKGGSVALITNQTNSAAIYADGDVSLTGISAGGYLASLAAQYPSIDVKYQKLKSAYQALKSFFNSQIVCPDDNSTFWDSEIIQNKFGPYDILHEGNFFDFCVTHWTDAIEGSIGWHDDYCYPYYKVHMLCENIMAIHGASERLGFYSGNNFGSWDFENPIASSTNTGVPYYASTSAIIPGLIESIKTSMGSQLDNDVAAQKVLKGLYELAWINRHMPGKNDTMTSPYQLTHEDRQSLEFAKYCIFNDEYMPYGPINPAYINDDVRTCNLEYEYLQRAKDIYLLNNPLDSTWCSDSYFQGVVYANGNINATNKMKIYGSLISHKDINIIDASVIYCQEYMNLSGRTCPLELILYREF